MTHEEYQQYGTLYYLYKKLDSLAETIKNDIGTQVGSSTYNYSLDLTSKIKTDLTKTITDLQKTIQTKMDNL